MKLTVWGARGSIAVSGRQYLAYGGDTTCIEIETADGEIIILDAGTGLRALGNKLMQEQRKDFHFLLSHAHWDHILGFPFFRPLYQKGTTFSFHGCTFTQQTVAGFLRETMHAPFFPVDLRMVAANLHFDHECGEEFEIGGLQCTSIPLNHPNGGFGFRLTEGGRSVVLFPDNELTFPHPRGKRFDDYSAFAAGADLLVHDAEYLPEEYEKLTRGWGHSIFRDTVRLGLEAEVGRLVLWHLNQDRTDDKVDEMAQAAQGMVKDAGADMPCEFARTGLEITIG